MAEEDELGLPTTASMLAPALTAEQQEEGRRFLKQDEHYDYEHTFVLRRAAQGLTHSSCVHFGHFSWLQPIVAPLRQQLNRNF